jgi:RNA polymerase-binding transcription factor DksA
VRLAQRQARLDEARGRLSAERVAAAARIAALERDITTIVESAKGGATDDEHDAEGATIAFERAQAMALLEETRIQVEALDTALARVDHGSYGVCESCGQDIAPERLVGPSVGHSLHHLRHPASLTARDR